MNCKKIKALFICCVISLEFCYSQTNEIKSDFLIAQGILSEVDTIREFPISLNVNGLQLDLTKKQALKIVKSILYSRYGRYRIMKERPFHYAEIGSFWVFWGSQKNKRKGGVFRIVINKKNCEIILLSHGK